MTASFKMAKLDVYTMKSQLVGYLSLVIIVLMFGGMGSSITMLGINVAWYAALMSSNIFAIQEKNNLDRLYGSVSVDLKNIVAGRYVFMVLNYLASFIASNLICFGIFLYQNKSFGLTQAVFGFGASFLVFSIIMAVAMPLFFKLGYTKARMWFFLPFTCVLGLAIAIPSVPAFSGVMQFILSYQSIAIVGSIIVSCAFLFFSYKISIVAYRKRK